MILGLNLMHDAAAALVADGAIVAAAEEERFTRRKHATGFPAQAIGWCLDAAGLALADVDVVAVGWKPWVARRRLGHLVESLATSPAHFRAKAGRGAGQIRNEWWQMVTVRRRLTERFGPGRYRLTFLDHHACHAASTFFASPFERAAILTVDGAGEETTTSIAVGEDTAIRSLSQIKLPHSLGQFYAAVTGFLGFRMQEDEYKVMGLAGGGEPRFRDFLLREVLRPEPGGGFHLDVGFLDYHLARRGIFLPRALTVLGPNRAPQGPLLESHREVAASAQQAVEAVLLHLAEHARRLTGAEDLCLAGGVAFNCVANGRLLREGPFRRLFVQPAAGDAGTALGAALAVAVGQGQGRDGFRMTHAALGPGFPAEDCRAALQAAGLAFQELAPEPLCREAAAALAESKLVFWFQGRMEWGPRALGQRSLLADPRRAEIRERINARVKRREAFRPFAPSVLAERAGEFFADAVPSPFMLLAFSVRSDKREIIPAVTHVDGTARPQTVDRAVLPLYWRLIRAFEEETGVPMVLNTSFNVQEPIVCTPQEAVACFLKTEGDVLALGPFLARPDR